MMLDEKEVKDILGMKKFTRHGRSSQAGSRSMCKGCKRKVGNIEYIVCHETSDADVAKQKEEELRKDGFCTIVATEASADRFSTRYSPGVEYEVCAADPEHLVAQGIEGLTEEELRMLLKALYTRRLAATLRVKEIHDAWMSVGRQFAILQAARVNPR